MSTEFLTVEQVAEICRVTVPTIRRWINDGRVPAVRVPGSRRQLIRRVDLERLLVTS